MSGLTGSPLLRPAGLLASLTETFTSGLSTVRSPSPLPDMTTVATGRFHRRVFHPLDLQLASLHWIRAFAGHSVLTCRPLRPRGVRRRSVPGSDVDIGLRRVLTGSALPTFPQSVSRGGSISWLQWFAHCYGLPGCLPPLNGSDRITPAIGDFYFWASSGSVTLPASRYNYSIDWTPLLAGLAPAGTAASFAAPPIATRAGLRLLPAITASPSRGPRRASARRTLSGAGNAAWCEKMTTASILFSKAWKSDRPSASRCRNIPPGIPITASSPRRAAASLTTTFTFTIRCSARS